MDHHKLKNNDLGHNTWVPSSLYDSRPTDLTLVVDSWKFHVHKDILEKSSDYFAAMFSSQMIECVKGVVDLHLVSPEHFKILIEGVYTGELDLTENNVYDIVQAAHMLQMRPPLCSQYIDFMKYNLNNLKHCLELMYFCVTLNLQELYSDVRRFCLAHFSELRHTKSLASLSVSELYDYLSDKYLVVEDEVHVVEAIHNWLSANKTSVPFTTQEFNDFKAQVKKLISSCVCLKDDVGACETVTEAVFCDENLPVETFQFVLAKRPRQEDVFMFWALLTSTDADGLVDVVRLSLDTGNCVKFDSMTEVVERPGFHLGSAVCASGPYVYLSGGGPSFGKANWIRQIWRFDVSKPSKRWEIIGDLIEFRRCHAMVILENKLYIFGGFGKFRTKNVQLDSLDLLTGSWEQLPPMPFHELNPMATVSDNKIFYICSNWSMYYFSTRAKSWSAVDFWDRCLHRLLLQEQPVALLPIKTSNSDCFIGAVVTLTDTHFRIPVLHIHGKSMKFNTTEEDIANVDNIFTYAGSAMVNGKVVLFLTSEKTDDTLLERNDTSTVQKAVIFDPSTNKFYDMPAVQNLRKVQSIIALPHLPSTFTMGSMNFL